MTTDTAYEPANPTLTTDDVAAEIAALAPWTQNLQLPDGTQTLPNQPLAEQPITLWEQFRDFLPADLNNRTALEIGCHSGFFAIELARRGTRVDAFETNALHLRQAHWAIGRSGLTEQIELYRGHIHELARWRRRHDIVLLLGQLHRLRYPLLALDIATRLTRRCLVLHIPSLAETPVEPAPQDLPAEHAREALREGWPKLAFVENSFGGDPQTWWIFNATAVEAMIRSTGFEVVARPGPGLYLCQPRRPGVGPTRESEAEFVSATGTMPAGIAPFVDDLTAPILALNSRLSLRRLNRSKHERPAA